VTGVQTCALPIFKDNKVLVKVHNETKKNLDPTCHAEINAIRKVCQILKTTNLSGCVLYTTCEPCPMCFAAAWWANISRIVYGATIEDAASSGRQIEVSSKTLNEQSGSKIEIKGEILREECRKLF
jgi:tRNA(Arg) A34 adenosine deaminase TadA